MKISKLYNCDTNPLLPAQIDKADASDSLILRNLEYAKVAEVSGLQALDSYLELSRTLKEP